MNERILRLNIAGSPVEWLNWEDAATLQARGMVAWTLGSPCMTVRGGRSRLTGMQSKLVLHSIMACEGRVFDLASRIPNLTNTSFSAATNTSVFIAANITRNVISHEIMWSRCQKVGETLG